MHLLGDDLPEELRKVKSRHFRLQFLKRQKIGLVSTKKRPSTSSESLNF